MATRGRLISIVKKENGSGFYENRPATAFMKSHNMIPGEKHEIDDRAPLKHVPAVNRGT